MCFSNATQPNQSPHPQLPPLLWVQILRGHYPPALITCGTDTRQLGTAPVPQSPLKLFKLASAKAAYLASPIAYCGSHRRSSCSYFAPSLCLLTDTNVSPCGPSMVYTPLHLGTVINKLSFQWQSSVDPLAYHT